LAEADKRSARGERKALLRCEGIYSSHLGSWRAQRQAGGAKGLAGTKPRSQAQRADGTKPCRRIPSLDLSRGVLLCVKVCSLLTGF
ncbi:MAG TPA: hypothetical protein VJN18_27615, partial [Polyangiaceae bacterium]|nr:hypothetical protein [Polyangiaceae bacterium]